MKGEQSQIQDRLRCLKAFPVSYRFAHASLKVKEYFSRMFTDNSIKVALSVSDSWSWLLKIS